MKCIALLKPCGATLSGCPSPSRVAGAAPVRLHVSGDGQRGLGFPSGASPLHLPNRSLAAAAPDAPMAPIAFPAPKTEGSPWPSAGLPASGV
jgi:hypothetical protein